MKKISFIGILTKEVDSVVGPARSAAVKLESIQKEYGKENVYVVSIHNWKQNVIVCFFQILYAYFFTENIFFNISITSFRFVYWLNISLNRVLKRRIHVSFIGNPILDINKNLKYINQLKTVDYLYFQTGTMKKAALEYGLKSSFVLYNFRDCNQRLDYEREIINRNKLCYMARIQEKKGIFDAIEVITDINKECKKECFLDIYGPIENKDEMAFLEVVKSNPYVNYCGKILAAEVQKVLSNYGFVIFPTKYPEGLPGTVVDSLLAGVPVLSSCWEASSEFIDDRVSGFIFEQDNKEAMKEAIIRALDMDECAYKDMCEKCRLKSRMLDSDIIMKTFFENIK